MLNLSRTFWNVVGLIAFMAGLMGIVYMIGAWIEAARGVMLS